MTVKLEIFCLNLSCHDKEIFDKKTNPIALMRTTSFCKLAVKSFGFAKDIVDSRFPAPEIISG